MTGNWKACPKCGTKNDMEEQSGCPHCGTKIIRGEYAAQQSAQRTADDALGHIFEQYPIDLGKSRR